MGEAVNPLVSTSKTSDSRQSVQLHPLVLLTISDYITRHTIRQQKGPIVGAILGSQHGRDITMEHAFECKTETSNDGSVVIDAGWFHDRLEQFRQVHKVASLDLVGWFTLVPTSGPQRAHLSIHRQLAETYNESVLLLAFHPSSLQERSSTTGDKLPITVYEPVYEAGGDDGDKVMESSGEQLSLSLRFKELPYSVETGEAEMIGVDFVARGGANAVAIPQTVEAQVQSPTKQDKGKGKANGDEKEAAPVQYLTSEEEDLIATISAKANAIRMLQRRIALIKKYLQSLPPCYLTDSSIQTCEPHSQISHPILRSIAALLARLSLLIPNTPTGQSVAIVGSKQTANEASLYAQESAAQSSDVALISLLGTLGTTLQTADKMNRKASVYENEWNKKRGGKGGFYDPVVESMLETEPNGEFGHVSMPVHG